MKTIYSYACKDYPGMETCPGQLYAESAEAVWQHLELHSSFVQIRIPTPGYFYRRLEEFG